MRWVAIFEDDQAADWVRKQQAALDLADEARRLVTAAVGPASGPGSP
jgi:hypothetical protein